MDKEKFSLRVKNLRKGRELTQEAFLEQFILEVEMKDLRKKKGLTQTELASLLGIKQSTVAMWETGKSVPGTNTLVKLADILDVDMRTLAESFPKLNKEEAE